MIMKAYHGGKIEVGSHRHRQYFQKNAGSSQIMIMGEVKSMEYGITFLGTSAAEGIPDPFCKCGICENARQKKAARKCVQGARLG